MSSFIARKLDTSGEHSDTWRMRAAAASSSGVRRVTGLVDQRIERGGERVWRLEDFRDLPFGAVAQALSRLTRRGAIQRLSKGVYYRPRQTAFGQSRPNPAAIRKLAGRRKTIFPAGIAAANLLGFTTQSSRAAEVATSSLSLPRKLLGNETVIHTRRPEAWANLSQTDAALLDFLRGRGRASELAPQQTIDRTLRLLSENGRFDRLLRVVGSEPPRVRAMFGALGEELGKNQRALARLRASLSPFSRFDFGAFGGLRHARKWQAKEPRCGRPRSRVEVMRTS
jgi:hypothetical protein